MSVGGRERVALNNTPLVVSRRGFNGLSGTLVGQTERDFLFFFFLQRGAQ